MPEQQKLEQLLERAIVDFGAAWHAPLAVLGDRLGLYKALATKGPLDSEGLARATNTDERYVREWLRSQAAGGYVSYEPTEQQYHLGEEQQMLLADEDSPVFFVGAFQGALAAPKILPRMEEVYRTGQGIDWAEQDENLFIGTERVFRPGYTHNLVQQWLPALDGVVDKLEGGGTAVDVGCGHGVSTILMAQGFPKARIIGVDNHAPSIETANRRAAESGVADRVAFVEADASDFDARDVDLVTMFDCLHDMSDPQGAARHVREVLNEDGHWMIVEPYAGEKVEDNLTPLGRAFYSASSQACTPCSKSHNGHLALGAQASEKQIAAVVRDGGFNRFRRVTENPFNRVFEARP